MLRAFPQAHSSILVFLIRKSQLCTMGSPSVIETKEQEDMVSANIVKQ